MAATVSPLPTAILHINHKPKYTSHHFPTKHSNSSYQPLISSLTLSKHNPFSYKIPLRKPTCVKASAASVEDADVTSVIPSETAQQIVSATSSGDDAASNIISILLFIAFVTLSILTVGVVYISVTDFLTNRAKEKFEKEEEAKKKKKSGKKVITRAKAGPRGFGQKIEEEDYD